jgi:hypothetical protein
MPFVSIATARDNDKSCSSELVDSALCRFRARLFTMNSRQLQPNSQLKNHVGFAPDTGNRKGGNGRLNRATSGSQPGPPLVHQNLVTPNCLTVQHRA